MTDFDSNGIAIDEAGNRIYQRYAEIVYEGKRILSGVYVGQSTEVELLVEPFRLAVMKFVGDVTVPVWEFTNTVATVRRPDIIHVFEPTDHPFDQFDYGDYDRPFIDVDAVARFILNPENTAPIYTVLREEICRQASATPTHGDGYSWAADTLGIVRVMPRANQLFADVLDAHDQERIAAQVLDRAAAIIRGAA